MDKLYIFLDIDGVLNVQSDWKKPFSLNLQNVQVFLQFLRNLKGLSISPKIILSSSWCTGFVPYGKHSSYVQELADFLAKEDVRILSKTVQKNDRGEEILDFIQAHNLPMQRCIIIDDDDDGIFEKFNNTKVIIQTTDSKKRILYKGC